MVGARIAARRIELGMSQDELARRLGYKSRSTVQKIEAGINDITQSKIAKFADALETTPAYIMGWNEEKLTNSKIGELSEEELDIIADLRRLAKADHDTVRRMIKSFSDSAEK